MPLRPFCGVMGIAPAEDGEFRTRPPGIFGGNMDVRELCTGATLYLPVLNSRRTFFRRRRACRARRRRSFYQRNRMSRDVTLRFHVHKHRTIAGPIVETPGRRRNRRDAVGRQMDCRRIGNRCHCRGSCGHLPHDRLSCRSLGLHHVHAYLLCSVAMNLRLSQVVNEPIFTVSARFKANPSL